MIGKLLIANRGEIAVRIIRTARRMGIATAAVYSDADAGSLAVEMADEAFRIGPAPAGQSYLDIDAVLAAARRSGADAVHPGYGFLSENALFAERVIEAGLTFVGPSPRAMRMLGLKHEAKRIAAEAGVPVVPGYDGGDQSAERLQAEARRIGAPLLVKAVAGGGGRGLRLVTEIAESAAAIAAAQREALAGFGDGRVMLETYVPEARHVEVQVMADRHGTVLHLGERDCSLQRRHQKVIEEAPAPGLPPALREAMCGAAVALAAAARYEGAGTVEFLVPTAEGEPTGRFHFLEMNTRLQVEHPVTEMVTGLDLVELQLRVAAGEALALAQSDVTISGHAIEARLYAEDPAQGFRPQTGRITAFEPPSVEGLRCDSGVRAGDVVTTDYDAMLGKLIAHGPSRVAALTRLAQGAAGFRLGGIGGNLRFIGALLADPGVAAARLDTGLIGRNIETLTAAKEPPLLFLGVAALALRGRFGPAEDRTPFGLLRGFRLWGDEAAVLHLAVDGRTVEISLQETGSGAEIRRGGDRLAFGILKDSPAHAVVSCGGETKGFRFWRDGNVLTVVSGATRHEIAEPEPEYKITSGHGGRFIRAPVPGKLAQRLAGTGDTVAAGDLVAIIEAMKTEFPLKAERAGVITATPAEVGSQVAQGDVVAEIGEAGGESHG